MILVVKQVKKFPIFDIFQGEGWENWSRILLKTNKAVLIGGAPLTIAVLKLVVKHIKEQNNAHNANTRPTTR